MSFKFVSKRHGPDDMLYNPDKERISFYQICGYCDKEGKKTVRKIIINEHGDITNVDVKRYTKKRIDNFIEHTRMNKYIVYPTHDISVIDLPNPGDILSAKSVLLNNDNQHTGYASF